MALRASITAYRMRFRASPSKLLLFRQCPRRYRFEHVDRLARLYRRPRAPLVMGAHVHEALRRLYAEIPPDERSPAIAERLLRNVWRRQRVGFSSVEEEREYGRRALAMMRRFCALSDLRARPLAMERTEQLAIDPGIVLVGRIDRVDGCGDGSLHVIDYKAGRRPAGDESRRDRAFQVGIYACLAEAGLRHAVTRGRILYLADGLREDFDFDRTAHDATLDEIRARVAEILGERAFAPRPGPWCGHCDYLALCAEGRGYLDARSGCGEAAPRGF